MAYFEWADDMVIDNGQIDAEHRKLVDLVNELHTATSQGNGQSVVADLLERLIADTAEHLRHEEMQMQQAEFPGLETTASAMSTSSTTCARSRQSSTRAASPWPRSCPRCCATGCRCTSGATTRSCASSCKPSAAAPAAPAKSVFTISTRVCRRGIGRSALLQILAIARLLLRFAPSSPSRSASCTPSREIVNTLLVLLCHKCRIMNPSQLFL